MDRLTACSSFINTCIGTREVKGGDKFSRGSSEMTAENSPDFMSDGNKVIGW